MKLGAFKERARAGIASPLAPKRKVRWKTSADARPKTHDDDDEFAKLFEPSTYAPKRKGVIVRPDIPHVDVRKLPPTETITAASMARSRARLADFADMPDEDE